ncbi:MAG: helix-turn-helix transcriptional regulator [Methylotenera sp.]|uniref:helix-turn-helix domain-containing protein n=1 Tax=Methylotenera sp. TaxID=2051956 RepID=UPI00273761DB|nr:helix-turn-helix transcriptional regulator [Methylotenera sp.]MDP2102100.1 helix-turn-helix transcriptional regulator [Methylotenera sp.]MDP2281060.1 helix-turn-helix transcriptional regulator [Methylotenera sp.]MDP3061155.1 helix-turn-helix transcriptional regulator [Methylotenera sp.]MDP3210924.1 helix-turn-helix transcriptional regulator [Methylotenera sp.]
MPLEISVAFGRVLRRLRLERGLSQETVGELASLQRKYISLLERADYQPKLETVFRLAEALGCTPSMLIAMVEEEAGKNL